MWGRMGDESPGPPGSYYYSSGEQATYFWNTFDQVLIRPSLLSRFVNKDLRVLEGDGKRSFLSKGGLPDPSVAGDHLPLLFRLRV
ncbi:MAG: hypothetical protein HYZ53_05920 [Planctomycetes bacterium]|nr:hypothetical protein [Planctomycetota bacterium]